MLAGRLFIHEQGPVTAAEQRQDCGAQKQGQGEQQGRPTASCAVPKEDDKGPD